MPNATLDEDLLSYALMGLEQRQRELASKIDEIRARINSGGSKPASAPAAAAQPATPSASAKPATQSGGKRALSPEARERIAEAQRKRWAAARKSAAPKTAAPAPAASAPAPAATKKAATTKRIMSPEARARIAAAQRKRWAAARKQA